MRRGRVLRAALGAAAAATLLVSGSAVQAAGSSYVALGDSYSSGTGTRTYLADGTTCQRSVYAYPSLLAAARGYSLNFRACSGATTADVASLQLSALSSTTSYVTISVGGNDAGFAAVVSECAKPSWASSCNAAVDRAAQVVTRDLPGRLASLYSSIRARAPYARVVVVGYPRIFNGEDCNAGTWFSPTEESRLNATADLLNATTATAAGRAGFTFANPTSVFAGHAVCDDPEWLNGLSNPTSASYHPNQLGHSSGYLGVVSARMGGSGVAATSAVRQRAAAAADDLAAQQRRYAAQDRAITPKPVVAPEAALAEGVPTP